MTTATTCLVNTDLIQAMKAKAQQPYEGELAFAIARTFNTATREWGVALDAARRIRENASRVESDLLKGHASLGFGGEFERYTTAIAKAKEAATALRGLLHIASGTNLLEDGLDFEIDITERIDA